MVSDKTCWANPLAPQRGHGWNGAMRRDTGTTSASMARILGLWVLFKLMARVCALRNCSTSISRPRTSVAACRARRRSQRSAACVPKNSRPCEPSWIPNSNSPIISGNLTRRAIGGMPTQAIRPVWRWRQWRRASPSQARSTLLVTAAVNASGPWLLCCAARIAQSWSHRAA
jgi:hypothetical protein